MATTTLTESTVVPNAEPPRVYGCTHIEQILKKHGERIRREYDSAMSVVIESSSKSAKVKVCWYLSFVDNRHAKIAVTLRARL
jgi:hypothetical protein